MNESQQANMDIVYQDVREQMAWLEERVNAVSSRLLCALSGEPASPLQNEVAMDRRDGEVSVLQRP